MLFVCSLAFSQTNYLTGPYKYYVGNPDPDAGWHQLEYNDISWSEGSGSIGFGDSIFTPHFSIDIPYPGALEVGDTLIKTPIAATTSLYLRYPFTIVPEDTADISGFSLEAYFDDGFIAYLNGQEFARVNMGNKEETAYYNTLTKRSHESQRAAGDPFPVAGYFISRKILDENLVPGKNIIAVEVHNDSIAGSDLFFECALKACLQDTNYNPVFSFWNGAQGIFTPAIRTKAYAEADSSNLPLIIIETDEYGIPFSHVEVPANMKLIDKGGGLLNHPSDTNYTYNGRISIEVRGNSSSYFPKQSFNIETQNPDGSNNNVSLLDMPAENDWKLMGPISDRSLLRNTFTFELGLRQGHWEPRSKYCELILNGEYLGLYALTEKIKPDKNRLNISKLTDTDLFNDEVTGGYIFWMHSKLATNIYYPKNTRIQAEQEAYINTFVEQYKDVIFADNWLYQEKDYRDYMNTESMLDYLIINELAKDHDKYSASTYMYKNRSDKDSLIYFGPLWDYNYAYGNTDQIISTDKWLFSGESGDQFRRLFQDTSLTHRFAQKWHNQRERFLHTDSLYALIDSLSTHIALARKRDSVVWDAYTNVNVYFANDTVYRYDLVIKNLKDWLGRRAHWIDTHIDSIYYPVSGAESINISHHSGKQKLKAFPNPFRSQLNLTLNCPVSDNLNLELVNPLGQAVQNWSVGIVQPGPQTITLNLPTELASGPYLLIVHQKGLWVGSAQVVKIE